MLIARVLAVAALVAAGRLVAPLPVAAAEIEVRATTMPELKAVFGTVESRTVVPARARITGTIRSIGVTEGDEVKEGQVIARVVDQKLALQLQAAEARLRELASQLDNARSALDRVQQLQARGNAAQSQLDQAKTQFDVVTNQQTAAEADRAVIQQQMSEGDIVAPSAGRVLTVPVTPGSVIMAGEPAARIASGPYFLRLSLPERHATEIHQGDSVILGARGAEAAKTTRQGRIAKVYPEIADGRVIADVVVADIGAYFVKERTLVWIPVGKRSVLAVPRAAITTRHGIDTVRIAGGQDVAVVLGEAIDTDRVEILTGLKDGDRVVVAEAAK